MDPTVCHGLRGPTRGAAGRPSLPPRPPNRPEASPRVGFGPMGRLVIILPLRDGAHRDVVGLLRSGPPFELSAEGLERFGAYVSTREAVLVLEGAEVGKDAVPWKDLAQWRDSPAWQRCAEAPPRLADLVASSERPPELAGLFFGPLPGPGDSEGGGAAGAI
jgi:hypothetical protein